MHLLHVIVLGVAVLSSNAAELPSYIKLCKKGDQKCVLENAIDAFPRMINGSKKYKIPPLNPLVIQKMELEQGGLKITMENVKHYFTDNLKFTSLTFDVDQKIFAYTFETPLCRILSDYEISGKILVLPISGKGKSNVTIENLVLDYTADIATERRADGKDYAKLLNAKHEVKGASRVYFDFTNLFNGDKTLWTKSSLYLGGSSLHIPVCSRLQDTAIPRMNVNVVGLLVCGVLISSTASVELPSYIKKCKRGDSKCYLGSAQAALGHFINGEKNFKLQSLNPFLVQSLEIQQGGLSIKMNNAKIYFAENLKFKDIRMDFDKLTFGYTFYSPLCQMLADYEVDGKILILPISGSGKSNITVVDLVLDYEAQCAFETRNDGEEYVKFVSGKHTTVSVGRAYYDLENLFNGDKTLGETTLKFMNENWLDIFKELDSLFLEALGEQERIILNNVAGSIPFKKLFLP